MPMSLYIITERWEVEVEEIAQKLVGGVSPEYAEQKEEQACLIKVGRENRLLPTV